MGAAKATMLALALLGGSALARAQTRNTATPPTFEQLLDAPDDPDLNIAYAAQQMREGNLLYAAAAYERILLEQPDADAVRLMYIDTLLMLDEAAGARREIAKLNPLTLDASQRALLEGYQTRLTAMDPEGGL